MTLQVYNTLRRRKEEFNSIHPGRVGIYVCGPTVYGDSHLGHAKSYVSFDVIVRWFRYIGYQVRYVQNITDVGHLTDDGDAGEDKIGLQAKLEKTEPMEIVENYTRSYFDDMDRLNNLRPNISPRASAHISEQIALIETLIDADCAYEANGNVYFAVRKAKQYGKLSGKKIDELGSGIRIDIAADKRESLDFALWKKADKDHIMRWPSPWGEGYPGWHLECSAMSAKYLGLPFDIHGGGIENIFPHHECEIAQSECAGNGEFAHYWLHNNMVTVDGVKMGKSLGNFVTLKDAFNDYDPMVIRLFILQSHYRSPLDFSPAALSAAAKGWQRLQRIYKSAQHLASRPSGESSLQLAAVRANLNTAMNDDFNTPQALAAIFDLGREINRLEGQNKGIVAAERELLPVMLNDFLESVCGLRVAEEEQKFSDVLPSLLDFLLELRQQLRANRDFTRADAIRERLLQLGYVIKDAPQGSTWERQS
jgi:cysteinyl-tRNA synthetase